MHVWAHRGQWTRVAIAGEVRFARAPDGAVALDGGGPPRALITTFAENGVTRAALVVFRSSEVLLNGYPPLPVAVLEDRDHIGVAGEAFFFGALGTADAVAFPRTDVDIRCGRCKRPLRAGDQVVFCPMCRAPHHQGALATGQRRACWEYDERCGGPCGRERASMLWTPEDDDDQWS